MTELEERQHWMAVLAKSSFAELKRYWQTLELEPEYTLVRRPEIGLVQIPGRMGGTGRAFNMGDVTVTRSVVRLASGELGYSYLLGRNKSHAELAAVIDALLQKVSYRDVIQSGLIKPLAEIKSQRDHQRASEVASSKVDFFTMVRGDA
ncbi:phosphonate C-P lyase system protein PhnG [Vibrio salinus]|uniref:phosphonate C-P lyase system protein PhnG n=1 Tax=Vibrio salinus TaxID=2899784 RepID=UPI001E58A0E3|nr:phosphonate C-P lyase system protein PhnG [Vibrio salinus]MCE0495283.1 phosphonate C-P lyase system protein PhnG [Vibrio salinus]